LKSYDFFDVLFDGKKNTWHHQLIFDVIFFNDKSITYLDFCRVLENATNLFVYGPSVLKKAPWIRSWVNGEKETSGVSFRLEPSVLGPYISLIKEEEPRK
jgi:hypothetical protein